MKQLDWKSFAIGVLLATTVMVGTGAATSTNEKWDSEQLWETKVTSPKTTEPRGGLIKIKPITTGLSGKPIAGWEPFQAITTLDRRGDSEVKIVWRKRVDGSASE
jgi:hypothetical protein